MSPVLINVGNGVGGWETLFGEINGNYFENYEIFPIASTTKRAMLDVKRNRES